MTIQWALSFRSAGWALAIVALSGATALGAPQSTLQQRCLTQLSTAGANVVKQQGKVNRKCLQQAARGNVDKLGDPGDTLTAQACMTNDPGDKVARKHQKTMDRDEKHCVGSGTPDFAYAGAAAINAAASGESRDLVAAVFGPDLDAAVADNDVDRDGARCQDEVLHGANRIVDAMWRVGRVGVSDGLKGRSRRAGAGPDLPAHSGENLQGEILAHSLDDAKGKIQKEIDRLSSRAPARCASAVTPLAGLFPGDCSGAASVVALVDCVAGVARGHYYQSVAGAFGMPFECDLTDDGVHDASCTSAAQQQHVFDRMGYGPDAWTIGRMQTLGLNAYIDEQLDPGAIDDGAVDAVIAVRYPSQLLNVVDVRDCYPQNIDGTCPGHEGGKKNHVWRDMEESEIYRAVASRRQMEAVLVDFWFNHFNVTGSAGQQKWNTPSYLRDSIRPYVLGNFEESVLRMTRGPAMLDYLDQRQNQVGVPPGSGYNENFARELLELHTLGVTAPWTEMDVKELARALTGWREEWNNEANFDPLYPGFRYQNNRHDFLGPKEVLGEEINWPADGEQEGFDAISLAARHPSTATFVCGKLVRRFVHEEPPYRLLDECAETFVEHEDDADQLLQVIDTILKSREFQLYPEYRRSKAKRPVALVPSLIRTIGGDPDPAVTNYQQLRNLAADLGERIRNADPPTGYPDASIVWASPGGLVQRFNLVEERAIDAAAGWGVSGAAPNADIVDDVIDVLFPVAGVSQATRNAAIGYLDSLAATDAEKVQQAGAFLLSSREFLLH
jgi:uncharacterized protein (DUF1800 family)